MEYVSDAFLAGAGEGEYMTCQIGLHDVLQQVDTGSQATLLSTSTYIRLGERKLKWPQLCIQSFSKDDIPLHGQTKVDVSHIGRKEKLEIVLTEAEHTDLLGGIGFVILEQT